MCCMCRGLGFLHLFTVYLFIRVPSLQRGGSSELGKAGTIIIQVENDRLSGRASLVLKMCSDEKRYKSDEKG